MRGCAGTCTMRTQPGAAAAQARRAAPGAARVISNMSGCCRCRVRLLRHCPPPADLVHKGVGAHAEQPARRVQPGHQVAHAPGEEARAPKACARRARKLRPGSASPAGSTVRPEGGCGRSQLQLPVPGPRQGAQAHRRLLTELRAPMHLCALPAADAVRWQQSRLVQRHSGLCARRTGGHCVEAGDEPGPVVDVVAGPAHRAGRLKGDSRLRLVARARLCTARGLQQPCAGTLQGGSGQSSRRSGDRASVAARLACCRPAQAAPGGIAGIRGSSGGAVHVHAHM